MAVIEAVMSVVSTVIFHWGSGVSPGFMYGSLLSLQPEKETDSAKRAKTATLKEQSLLEFFTCNIIFLIISDYYYMVIFEKLVGVDIGFGVGDIRSRINLKIGKDSYIVFDDG
jgi:hypothetical protein